ncbi:MAG: serine hydrolase [Microgenomates group bacterium]
MRLFGKKKEEEEFDDEEELMQEEEDLRRRKIRDLKPENRKKRKEPPKVWGKKERYIVFGVFFSTIVIAGFLAMSAREFKLPGFPRLSFNFDKPSFNLNIFKEQTIVVGSKYGNQINKSEKIISEFKQKTNNLSGVYALEVVDLSSDFTFGIDEDKVIQAASLIKLPTLAALYRASEEGNIDLETKYTLKNSDKRSGSGSLSSKPAGTVLSYRDLARLMGKESDNTAFNIIRNLLGDEKIDQVAKEIGMTDTLIEENTTTPKDIGTFFQKLWKGLIVSEDNRDEILGFLTDTIYENWLVKGVPSDVRVAHKYGRETHVINDGGIVFARNPYAIVIMSQGIVESEGDQIFPDLSRIVYNEMLR